jgi:hypothetical protein
MGLPNYITNLCFSSYFEYYDYIIESRYNGQHAQARELFDEFDTREQDEFFYYLESECGHDPDTMHIWKVYFGLEKPIEE